ncbi:helix-turn-helix domain-containing protein [Conexibacter sp. JD483]|uniref:ArsR/SmtB family transcription factor n=1 Tax=unclassified Conexibacter TaxID=2627773 RepID=UPI002723EAAE|nr:MULTISPECIES: helix-turn-helix domain-containing protein [unclassified Conexibacter]MDO8187999.1 helix-turn-helix domain-containing protein [Conexibacter sp. CPCC 205706]MDO8200882.1 helix-turn-helix domain-containing protein [Conexibacter sp. CPCC 205762]MDR9370385.1 helix-turn-helix domain-containing protein [Conexibacter sp. JD483]
MSTPDQPSAEAIELTSVMHALSDDARLAVVRALACGGERPCGSFDLGVSKATASHHFRVLREAGITETRVDGKRRLLSLRRDDLDGRFPGLLTAILTAAGSDGIAAPQPAAEPAHA